MRRLRAVRAAEVPQALRAALAGGDAVLPLAEGAERPHDLPGQVPQRVAVVVETSGSSGRPKRVMLSADALLASAAASASAFGGPGQWMLALPTHYIAGLNVLVRSIAAQNDPVPLVGRFEPQAFIEAVGRMDASRRYVALVPTQLARILEHPEARRAALRLDRILVGGQATPATLLAEALDAGLAVSRSYGSSETSGGCVYDGRPIGDTRLRIVDGQVQVAGSVLAEGYLADEQLTAERFVDDAGERWYRTGDLGRLGDGGPLEVTGRADDVIISGGVKVSLGAVERVVRDLPGLADAVVVAAPHPEWGDVPVVVTTHTADLDGMRAAVGHALGAAARPFRVLVVDELPLLPSGKPDRRELTVRAAQR
ncbi:O-succinylbenzoic acid--CoA ligase [Diaminobutyricimonas aerilata]|uniref:O-succinylbenzoic acid--CoA ligase n=1 Tax=Diaminobutyricimonas aerilata TaxID=1162967 RepID=A0A2M9CGB0_9MICO|nr:AMP-binding protein [Diaminobutyricimonas aerilata]PJJ70918.1 O-succinylbenzoic acid--CoA ligase [Diaminobutyricimonas aerilata]